MRRLVVSSANAARLDAAATWLADQAGPRPGRPFVRTLVLGPSRRAADDLVRGAALAAGALAGVVRTTLPRLAEALAAPALARDALVAASPLGTAALVMRAAHQVGLELEYFRPVAAMPGFARALVRTIGELRRAEVPAAALEGLGPRGRDLARLLLAYEGALAAQHLADARRVAEAALAELQAGRSPWRGAPLLVFDLEPQSALEERLLEAALAQAGPLLVALSARATRAAQLYSAALERAPELIDPGPLATALDRAKSLVFSSQEPPRGALDETLEFFSAPGEGREVVEIARRILRAAREGLRLDQIAVFLRNVERYQPLLEEALARADLPAFFTRGSLRPDPGGRAFLLLLSCGLERLSAERFAEYLSLGQVPPLDADGRAPRSAPDFVEQDQDGELGVSPPEDTPDTLFAPERWERILVEAAVVGSPERWQRRLAGYEEELTTRLAEVEAADLATRERLERERERLVALERFALPLVETLARLAELSAPWGAWLKALESLAVQAIKHPAPVLAALAELRPLAEAGPVGLPEVSAVLAERLGFLRAPPAERRYGKVFVGSIEEAAGRSFELVFLPGLGEGIFPRKHFEDPLLLDEHRRALTPRLACHPDRSQEERALLERALGAARRRVVASYPRLGADDARPRVPSFYALDLLRAAEGRLPELPELEKRAAEAADARLGWPAPRVPEEAIDDAEYDLAYLDLVSSLPDPSASAGMARYLIEVDLALGRSLRTRAARDRKRWRRGEGLVDADPATLALLVRHRLRARPHAVTNLESFAACPYRFFLQGILRLHPRGSAGGVEELDERTRGKIFHKVQAQLLARARAAGLLPLKAADHGQVLGLLGEVLDEVGRAEAERLCPAIPRVWERELELLRLDLHGWVAQVIQEDFEWLPAAEEHEFGPLTVLEQVELKGSIDLVERHQVSGELRVTDHKTGRPPEPLPRAVGGGKRLQPLLYAEAAELSLGGRAALGRLSYCTQRGGYVRADIEAGPASRARAQRALAIIDGEIARGFLPQAPEPGGCERCDFRRVCGPGEERRLPLKDTEPLGPLLELRGMP